MINDFTYEGKDNWKEFKREFSNNIDNVGNALNEEKLRIKMYPFLFLFLKHIEHKTTIG